MPKQWDADEGDPHEEGRASEPASAGNGNRVDFHCMIQVAIQAAVKLGGPRIVVAAVAAAAINTVAHIRRFEKHDVAERQDRRSKGGTQGQNDRGLETEEPQSTHVDGLSGQECMPQAETRDMEVDAVWQVFADAA